MTKKEFEKNINKSIEQHFDEVNDYLINSNIELIQFEKKEEYDKCIAIRDSINNIIDFKAEILAPLLKNKKDNVKSLLDENNHHIYKELSSNWDKYSF